MPALAPYIPTKEADLNNWLSNFSTLISGSPTTYGLTSTDATNISGTVSDWAAAYALCTSPTTKTASTVAAKDTQKVTTLALIRPYAQQVSRNPGVTSGNKIALGLNPQTSTPSPITPPASNPVLSILSMQPGAVNFTYRDNMTSPTSKAKPYGVTSCQLYGMQSDTVVTDPSVLPQVASLTKSPSQFMFPGGYTPGKIWYFAAKWQIRTGGQSPFSPIISVVAT